MRVVNLLEMKEIEKKTFEGAGPSETVIIENVGIRIADFIAEKYLNQFDSSHDYKIFIVVGLGNNGADGLACARHLFNQGYDIKVVQIDLDKKLSKENILQKKILKSFGKSCKIINNAKELSEVLNKDKSIVVDGIFGTGLRTPLPEEIYKIFEVINNQSSNVVSIDIPSGVNGDSGLIGYEAIQAEVTLSISLPKIGHFVGEGPKHCGKLKILDAGFNKNLLKGGDKALITNNLSKKVLLKRSNFKHKSDFGHVLVIGGSVGLAGAASLASISALKVGAGLVTAMTWENSISELNAKIEKEIMTKTIPEGADYIIFLEKEVNNFDSIVIGPGLGNTEKSYILIQDILNNYGGPIVIDADGLNVLKLSKDKQLLRNTKNIYLTPHIGEFIRFLEIDKNELMYNLINILKGISSQLHCNVILKDFYTYFCDNKEKIFINNLSNSGMATAGSGDVLAGILGGLLANKECIDEIKELIPISAIRVHSIAGQLALKKYGDRSMVASSILDHLPKAMNVILDLEE